MPAVLPIVRHRVILESGGAPASLCGEPDIFVTAPEQPGLSGKRKGGRVAEMVRIGADMRRAVRGVRGEPLADAPRLFGAVAIGSVEQGKPVPAGKIGRAHV